MPAANRSPPGGTAALRPSPRAEIHHFIGKDIASFRTLFWPAMLEAAGLALPTKVRVHGFLTVNRREDVGEPGHLPPWPAPISTTSIQPRCGITTPANCAGGIDDLDLNLDEFAAKVNADLVGKVVNLAEPDGAVARGHGPGRLSRRRRARQPRPTAAIAAAYED